MQIIKIEVATDLKFALISEYSIQYVNFVKRIPGSQFNALKSFPNKWTIPKDSLLTLRWLAATMYPHAYEIMLSAGALEYNSNTSAKFSIDSNIIFDKNAFNKKLTFGVSDCIYNDKTSPYDMLNKRLIVYDGDKYLHNSKRTKRLLMTAENASYVDIFLDYCFETYKPINLFYPLAIMRNPVSVSKSWYEYRYCDPKEIAGVRNVNGRTNIDELEMYIKGNRKSLDITDNYYFKKIG